MNVFFWLLVLIGTVILWFALRGIFIAIGRKFSHLIEDTENILTKDFTEEELGEKEK